MSMETHVFFRGKLPSKAALSRAMKELGFPYSIKPATGSLEQQNGFMPMTFRRQDTGVEFDVFEGREAIDELEPGDPTSDQAQQTALVRDFLGFSYPDLLPSGCPERRSRSASRGRCARPDRPPSAPAIDLHN